MGRITMTVLGYEFSGNEGRDEFCTPPGDGGWVELRRWVNPKARTITPSHIWTCDFMLDDEDDYHKTRASGEGATPEDAMRVMVATADFQRILSTMNQLVERAGWHLEALSLPTQLDGRSRDRQGDGKRWRYGN